ncbi:MAG TPA: CUAEP/CCAEP-tail radical SAM protein, partial [Kofleriaceae bacterium]|nr:CUAEP/CCAEP-tail radical SAM protein [Kofleriaceae bacterium]
LLDRARAAGLTVRPTFVPFTPWPELADIVDLTDVIAARELEAQVAPVQLSVRLLVPAGSLLLERPELTAAFGAHDPAALGHRWRHGEARVDRLQADIAALVAQHAREDRAPEITFDAIRTLARSAAGLATSPSRARPRPRTLARLSEPWFC